MGKGRRNQRNPDYFKVQGGAVEDPTRAGAARGALGRERARLARRAGRKNVLGEPPPKQRRAAPKRPRPARRVKAARRPAKKPRPPERTGRLGAILREARELARLGMNLARAAPRIALGVALGRLRRNRA